MNGKKYIVNNILTTHRADPKPAQLGQSVWNGGGGVTARFAVSHDGVSLHILLEAMEPEPRAAAIDPLDDLSGDSSLGLILAPAGDPRYFCFEFNPLGVMGLSLGTGRSGRVRLSPNSMAQFNILPFREGDVWGLTFRIPLDFIRLFFPGFELRGEAGANVFKRGELSPQRHLLTWSPLTGPAPELHRPEDFGSFIFE